MDSYETDLRPLLHPAEWDMAELAQAQGIAPLMFFGKLREFEATYPESWSPLLKTWIETSGDERNRAANIAATKERIRLKNIRLMEMEHTDELESLTMEELSLDGRLNPKPGPAGDTLALSKIKKVRKVKQPHQAKE